MEYTEHTVLRGRCRIYAREYAGEEAGLDARCRHDRP